MELIINAFAYIIVLEAIVFLINPLISDLMGLPTDHYKDAVFSILILELFIIGVFAGVILIISAFIHVF